jgi:hypothetical protein
MAAWYPRVFATYGFMIDDNEDYYYEAFEAERSRSFQTRIAVESTTKSANDRLHSK